MQQAKEAPGMQPAHSLWYKDAVIYQLHVRAFYDSNGDGIGDFAGLTERLGYLKDLGVNALWLLPFYPSPLKDDGYDIADYTSINPMYGTLGDFKLFLRTAHKLGIKVITEMVLNHTSDQHPWFQRARRAPEGAPERDFYVWSDNPDRYKDARIIFKDFETSNWAWDPVAKAYYWHRFYGNQPDLNFNNPAVQKAMLRVVDFWMEMGVDGMRLDAVPYLFEREDTCCENLPETHEFLRKLRQHVDLRFKDRMLLAEANQWPEEAMSYFGGGDECHMCFHFPLMPRMFMSLEMEDRFPVVDILQQTPQIPATSQWAVFLRNHDELTLEMVTDEERDYMYRVYAVDSRARINLGIRRRLAPLLGNNRRKIELLNGLLFALPGTPVVYYGDEIGMGDNIYLGDRNGVRTPLQWSGDRNAGFSTGNTQQLYLPVVVDHEFHYEAVNVENHTRNPNSLLWWMKRLMAIRRDCSAMRRGELKLLHPSNRKVLAFIREHGDEVFVMVANMSRAVQCAELDLSQYQGRVPQELFGLTEFPKIGDRPYFITLGAHQFYWFLLQKKTSTDQPCVSQADQQSGKAVVIPDLRFHGSVEKIAELFGDAERQELGRVLQHFLERAPWFHGHRTPERHGKIKYVEVTECVPMDGGEFGSYWCVARVQYFHGESDTCALPVSLVREDVAAEIVREHGENRVIAKARNDAGSSVFLCDGISDPTFRRSLLDDLRRSSRRMDKGISAGIMPHMRALFLGGGIEMAETNRLVGHSSVSYGDRLFLKLNRQLGNCPNPQAEIGEHLSGQPQTARFPVPRLVATLDYRPRNGVRVTIGTLEEYVPSHQSMWDYSQDSLARYYEIALSRRQTPVSENVTGHVDLPEKASVDQLELVSSSLPAWTELGGMTWRLHSLMGIETGMDRAPEEIAPEPFTELYQRSLYQAMRARVQQSSTRLREFLAREGAKHFPDRLRDDGESLLKREGAICDELKWLLRHRLSGMRIRCHGDYTLHRVLFTGRDFVALNFEGEHHRPWSERRIKRSALTDLAAMIGSIHSAAELSLMSEKVRAEDREWLRSWKTVWAEKTTQSFMDGYFKGADGSRLFPRDRGERQQLLRFYGLQRAFQELDQILECEPAADRVWTAVRGLLEVSRFAER